MRTGLSSNPLGGYDDLIGGLKRLGAAASRFEAGSNLQSTSGHCGPPDPDEGKRGLCYLLMIDVSSVTSFWT